MEETLDHRPDSRKTRRKRAAATAGQHRWPGRSALLVFLVLLATVAAGCGMRAPAPAPRPAPVDARIWAGQRLARLSLEEKVAQLLVPVLPAGIGNAQSAELRNAQRLVRELGIGGFLVPPGPPLETAAALNALQDASALPLLFAADYDGITGGVLREADPARGREGGTLFPGNPGLAATGQPLHAELAARVAGREARAVGVRWLLGPVATITGIGDVTTEPGAFSDDPATVVRFAGAAVRGAASAQVLTTVRPFPARVTAEARKELPLLSGQRAALEGRELAVLRELLRLGGVDALMLGNARWPALTGDSVTPITLSPAVGTGLLRRTLGFEGVIVTDRLDDPALRAVPGYGPGEIAVRALEAGADVLLAPIDPAIAHRAIIAAVRSGRLPYNRVDDAARRVLYAKAMSGLGSERRASLDSVFAVVGAPEHGIVAGEVAAQSLVLMRDSASLLPLDPRHVQRVAVLAVAAPGATEAGVVLGDELRRTYGAATTFERIDERTADSVVDAAIARAGLAQAVVLAVFEHDRATAERGRVSRFAARVAQRLRGVNRRVVVVSFGDPVPGAWLAGDALLLAWQPRGSAAQLAAARALSGRSPIAGVLPINWPGGDRALARPVSDGRLRRARAAEVGMDSADLERIDGLLLGAIHQGASPGAAIAVGRHGRIVKLRGYGRIDYRVSYADVTDSTIYDLASLTKVVGTTSALALLVERGVLDLDAPVGHYIPEWNTTPAKARVTLRHLALHSSGLAAYGPLYQQLRGREEYRHRIARMDLTYSPGTRTVYSDFGVILLGLIIEQVTGEPLDAFLQRELFEPLGMRDTGYNPLSWPYAQLDLAADDRNRTMPPFVLNRIAPTEVDTVFRRQQMHGRVHDENAFALGGVAGHAGLFSSARDLAVFAQLMLDRGYYGGRRLLDPEIVASFTRRAHPESSRAIGWDTPSDASSAGDYFSAMSYGHTGFTGTSIWIDPERDLFVILLTNRVNPSRANQKHVPLRRAVADAVQLAVRDVEVAPRETFEFGTR